MVPHSSTLAWKIPRTEEPGRLQPMGSRRFGHDWATSLPFHQRPDWYLKRMFPSYVLSQLLIYLLQSSLPGMLLICLLELVAWMVKNLPAMQETWVWSLSWEDPLEWLLTPVFLPGEFHGQRSLVGYSLWCHKESDTTEQLTLSLDFTWISFPSSREQWSSKCGPWTSSISITWKYHLEMHIFRLHLRPFRIFRCVLKLDPPHSVWAPRSQALTIFFTLHSCPAESNKEQGLNKPSLNKEW